MKIRFRGGPKHNTSMNINKVKPNIFMAEHIPFTLEDFEENDRLCRVTHAKFVSHKYQLGKDKNGKQFYFYIGV